MKTIVRITAVVIMAIAISFQVKAQEPGSWRLGVGLNPGVSTNSPSQFVLGVDARLQRNFGSSVCGILTTGYTHFFSKDYVPASNIIPLKAGAKVFATRNFYIAGELGAGFGLDNGWGTSFVWSPSVGLAFKKGLDLSLKYEDFTKYTSTKQVALRMAYGFRI